MQKTKGKKLKLEIRQEKNDNLHIEGVLIEIAVVLSKIKSYQGQKEEGHYFS